MGKTIRFTYDNRDYVLEYTKRTIKRMEEDGFDYGEVEKKPMTMIPLLVKGAFLAHQRWIKDDEVDEILAVIKNKEAFYTTLSEMYAEQMKFLVDTEDEGKNVEWTVV